MASSGNAIPETFNFYSLIALPRTYFVLGNNIENIEWMCDSQNNCAFIVVLETQLSCILNAMEAVISRVVDGASLPVVRGSRASPINRH
jgi:hypothetical protein